MNSSDSDRPKILQLNSFFEPNPFNTGPPIPFIAPAYVQSPSVALLDVVESGPMQNPADIEPDLSSSAGNTPASTVQALPLDHPYIKRIWNDSRFDAIQIYHPGDADSYGYYPDGFISLNHPHAGRDYHPAALLNPLAKTFVPSFSSSSDSPNPHRHLHFIDHSRPNFSEEGRLSPLEFESEYGPPSPSYLHTFEDVQFGPTQDSPLLFSEGPVMWSHPPFPPQNYTNSTYEAPLGDNTRPLYPPGLRHPPHPMDSLYFTLSSDPLCSTLPLAYTLILLSALNPHLVPQEREIFVRSIFEYIAQWDAWNLRELAARTVVTIFGPEEDGKQEEEEEEEVIVEDEPVNEDNKNNESRANDIDPRTKPETNEEALPTRPVSVPIPDDVFSQLISGLCTQFSKRLGEDYMIGFLIELTSAVFRRFRSLFATVSPS